VSTLASKPAEATDGVTSLHRPIAARRTPSEPRWVTFALIAPGWAFYALFVLIPLAATIAVSFTAWNGLSAPRWLGLDNYVAIVTTASLREALAHAVVLVAFFSFIPIAIGLVLAGILGTIRLRGVAIFQTALFLPQVVASVVVAMAWRWLYTPDGPVNAVLRAVGLGDIARGWLGDFDLALGAVGVAGTWATMGLTLVLFLAGIARIEAELYEAARIDGATMLDEFRSITLPLLRPEIAVALVLTIIRSLRTFDLVYNMTQGGPGTATVVPAYEIYRRAFLTGDVGLASALAVVLTAIILVVSVATLRVVDR
jgi:raffinose/stachyose/melibiose transport system permease protein